MAESARGLADYVTAQEGAARAAELRDRPRHAAPLGRVRRAVRPRAGGGRVPGLPLPRVPLDPPALLRRPAPPLRRRHHDHGLAQSALGQRLQVLLVHRRPGDPARRSRHHRVRQGGLGSRDPREAAGRRRWPTARSSWAGPELDDAYIAVGRERVGQPRPRPLDRLHAAARRGRDLGRRRARRPRASRGSTSSSPSARPTATSPTCPATSPTPSIPGRSRRRSRGPEPGRRPRARQRPGRRPHRRRHPGHRRSARRVDDPRRQPDRRPARRVRDEGDPRRSAGSGPTTTSSRRWSRPR